MEDAQIGWLVEGRTVYCLTCSPTGELDGLVSKLFRSNIGDYQQHCHRCGICMVAPKTPAWPELFPGGDLLQVKVNNRWEQVDEYIFRSWAGLRKKNGRDYHGIVYVLGTNELGDPRQQRECSHCEELQDALVEAVR